MDSTQVRLSPEMRRIIAGAIADGACGSPEEAILSALRQWRSECLADAIGADKVHELLRRAAEDTRPGKPAEEVFARLMEPYRQSEQSSHAADAA